MFYHFSLGMMTFVIQVGGSESKVLLSPLWYCGCQNAWGRGWGETRRWCEKSPRKLQVLTGLFSGGPLQKNGFCIHSWNVTKERTPWCTLLKVTGVLVGVGTACKWIGHFYGQKRDPGGKDVYFQEFEGLLKQKRLQTYLVLWWVVTEAELDQWSS